jgi:hypothetical protein
MGDTPVVFVHEPAGFFPVEVKIIAREEKHTIVSGGLAPDWEVAASGIASLKAAWSGRDGG